MKKTARFLFIIGIFLAACSVPPSAPSPEGAGPEPTLLPTLTPASIPSQTPPPDALSTMTPTAVTWPTDFTHVLYSAGDGANSSFILLGGVDRDGWFPPDESTARYSGEATYSLHNMEHVGRYFLWGGMPEYSVTCKTYYAGIEADLDEAGFVGTLDGWEVTQHGVTELPAEDEFYRQVVTDWLTKEGVSAPQIDPMQIFRVDIEGDGVDEVFLSAHHFADETGHMTEAGDYSLVLMRKVTGDMVLTTSILQDIYTSQEPELRFPFTYSIANFIDLNQNGILEMVIEINRWEGFGAAVYEVDGQEVDQVLREVCAQ